MGAKKKKKKKRKKKENEIKVFILKREGINFSNADRKEAIGTKAA